MEKGKQLLFSCENCKRLASSKSDNSTFKLCSGCHNVHYCNRECQLADRKNHKACCKAVKANDSNSTKSILNVDNLLNYCEKGDVIGIKREIAKGNDLSAASNGDVFVALTHLIYGRFYECAELLFQRNINPNVHSLSGLTPLHVACSEGYEEFVALFLQHKVNPHIANNMVCGSPLHLACLDGYDKCVLLLLQHNADPNILGLKNGVSPLHSACSNGHDKCVSLLLQYNADPNIKSNTESYTPLHLACKKGHDKCVSLLLQAGANSELIDKTTFTPFQLACIGGHFKCVALLFDHDGNTYVRDSSRLQSVLILCCMSRNVNLVTYILSLGVDVNASSSYGVTPIQYCHAYGFEKVVKLLIEHGADASNMTSPTLSLSFPRLLDDQANVDELFMQCKGLRHEAKHCDYPDCCNEGNDSQSLHACSSCRAVYYCSREHQAAHWKDHKKLCKAVKK